MASTNIIAIGGIVILCMLLGYLFIGSLIEKYKFSFGHEASLTILIGKLLCKPYA